MQSIHGAGAVSVLWRFRAVSQDELPDGRAALEQPVCLGGSRQRQGAVDPEPERSICGPRDQLVPGLADGERIVPLVEPERADLERALVEDLRVDRRREAAGVAEMHELAGRCASRDGSDSKSKRKRPPERTQAAAEGSSF